MYFVRNILRQFEHINTYSRITYCYWHYVTAEVDWLHVAKTRQLIELHVAKTRQIIELHVVCYLPWHAD